MRILVINLLRLGDLVQCSPVLRALRRRYPEAQITLVVQDVFQETAGLLPGPDRLVTFPALQLAPLVDGGGDWPQAYQLVADWLQTHIGSPPDLVVNLTPDFLGALLSYLSRGREVRGFTLGSHRSFFTQPAWMSYLMIISRARKANPFNLVDIFLKSAGLDADGEGLAVQIPPSVRNEAASFLEGAPLAPTTSLVGLVPGASQPQRCWPPERYAQVAGALLAARPCHFFIFGNHKERPLGEAIAALLPSGTATLCTGGTSIPFLAALLSHLHLLITNDTGPMHLAAAVNTPVLAFFLAGARVQDTGPVGEGHLALEPRLACHPCHYPDSCSLFKCHEAFSPEGVAAWALRLLEKKALTPIPDASCWRTLQVYHSTWDPTGHHAHLPLIRRPLDRKHFWTLVHRAAWPRFLDGTGAAGEALERWLLEIMGSHFLPPRDDLGLPGGHHALNELVELTAQGEGLARRLIGIPHQRRSPSFLWQQAEAIRSIDPKLHRLLVGYPEIASFIEFYFQEQRSNDADTYVNILARQLAETYHHLHQAGKICLQVLAEFIRYSPVLSQHINMLPDMAYLVQQPSITDPYQPTEVAPCK
jgi:ADP-heptose:LPS heptosyltransferase